MNAKERFQTIIDTIEQMINEKAQDDHAIIDNAFDNANFPKQDREKNVLSEFLLERKWLDYISERKLMAAYRVLLNEDDDRKAIARASEFFKHDYSYFSTKFSAQFGMSPGRARKNNAVSLYKAPPTWESFSRDEEEKGMDMIALLFDLPESYTKQLQEALNLKSFYSLNEEEGKYAYSLSKTGLDMETAFKYIADYVGDNQLAGRDDRLKTDLSREDVKYLYFDCDLGFNDIFSILLMKHINQISTPITECNQKFLNSCLEYLEDGTGAVGIPKDLETSFQAKYDYYMESTDDKYTDMDFEVYLLYLNYYDYKTAFSMLAPGLDDREEVNRIMRIYGKTPKADELVYRMERDDSYQLEEDDEGYDFDFEEFERLCAELDGDVENAESNRPKSKRLTRHKDLDVEGFWKDFSAQMNQGLPF